MSNTIRINKGPTYEVPNGVMPAIMDLVAPFETEETKKAREEMGLKPWPGSEAYNAGAWKERPEALEFS